MHSPIYTHSHKHTHIHTPCSRKIFQTNLSNTRGVKNESQKTRRAWRLLWCGSRAVQSGETSWYLLPTLHRAGTCEPFSFIFVFVPAICVAETKKKCILSVRWSSQYYQYHRMRFCHARWQKIHSHWTPKSSAWWHIFAKLYLFLYWDAAPSEK